MEPLGCLTIFLLQIFLILDKIEVLKFRYYFGWKLIMYVAHLEVMMERMMFDPQGFD